jgi:hypothetical protein
MHHVVRIQNRDPGNLFGFVSELVEMGLRQMASGRVDMNA